MASQALPLLICVPAAAGVLCLFIPDGYRAASKAIALLVSSACMAGAVYVFMKRPPAWQCGGLDILRADSLSALIGAGAAFFALAVIVYSAGSVTRSCGRHFAYLLMTLGAALGVAFSNNLIAMAVFWGFLAAMLYLMVTMAPTDGAAAAGRKALIIIGSTYAVMLFGIMLVWSLAGTFSIDSIRLPLDGAAAFAAFLAFAAASFAKAGAMPFHSWLPDVAEDGPVEVTACLPASLDKLLGIYLLARASLHIFVMNACSNILLSAAGAVTIILAVTIALVQHDMKRLLGYHAVSQVGYMILGIGTGTAVGIAGGLFHMLNNAVYKSCLFLSGGSVEKKAGTADLAKLGGLARYMPVTFACFLVASLAISGIQPFNGFVSKWMIYQGIIESAGARNPAWVLWLACAMFGGALTIASFMKLVHAVFLGRPSEGMEKTSETGPLMAIPVIVLAFVCVAFGVLAFAFPVPVLIMPAVAMNLAWLGAWKPVLATAAIVAGIALGLAVYFVSGRKLVRTVGNFVGGEDPEKLGRVSGVEFYDTVKDLRIAAAVYEGQKKGLFDVYSLGRAAVYPLSRGLQYLHNGILPTYLVWCLLGMAAVFLFLFLR